MHRACEDPARKRRSSLPGSVPRVPGGTPVSVGGAARVVDVGRYLTRLAVVRAVDDRPRRAARLQEVGGLVAVGPGVDVDARPRPGAVAAEVGDRRVGPRRRRAANGVENRRARAGRRARGCGRGRRGLRADLRARLRRGKQLLLGRRAVLAVSPLSPTTWCSCSCACSCSRSWPSTSWRTSRTRQRTQPSRAGGPIERPLPSARTCPIRRPSGRAPASPHRAGRQ